MTMKKLLWGAVALAALAVGNTAFAADIPAPVYKAPPPVVAPFYNWTGFYVGLNAGGVVNSGSRYEQDPAGCFLLTAGNCGVAGLAGNPFRTFSNSLSRTGFTGGGQVGYNYQTGFLVLGIESDLNYSGLSASDSTNTILTGPLTGGNAIHSFSEQLNWFGTLRGRVGVTVTPTMLLYATGGLAYGQVNSTTNVLFPPTCCAGDNYFGSISTTRLGWTAGAGVEWMFAPHWSVKAEYLYIDLGTFSYADPITNGVALGLPTAAYSTSLTTREHVARLGVNYHFDWAAPAPVSTKY
jgi:outer membrane immunogenic protein